MRRRVTRGSLCVLVIFLVLGAVLPPPTSATNPSTVCGQFRPLPSYGVLLVAVDSGTQPVIVSDSVATGMVDSGYYELHEPEFVQIGRVDTPFGPSTIAITA